jgi:NAD(P)-dependent dehydrogenase (short-subunit alcohol dehydrogenase family)
MFTREFMPNSPDSKHQPTLNSGTHENKLKVMKILIFGAYGNFGKRICESLIKMGSVEIVVAGRSSVKVQAFATLLNQTRRDAVTAVALNSSQPDLSQRLAETGAELVVNASGPFQRQDYSIANACVAAGVDYLDLADSREFVSGIHELDSKAKRAGIAIVSGVSTVPALSSVVVDRFQNEFAVLDEYYGGITPGYEAERGDATTTGVLSYLGHPISVLAQGRWISITALQGLHAYNYQNELGSRLLGYVDVPDLELFPCRYPTLKTVRFYSGLEIGFMHLLLWCMTWLSRWGLIKTWEKYAKPLIKISHCFDWLGTPDGGMFIELKGKDRNDSPKKVIWHLIARDGDGPYVPTIPIVVLVKKILNGEPLPKGAYPCMGMFTLDEFFKVASNWVIEQRVRIE